MKKVLSALFVAFYSMGMDAQEVNWQDYLPEIHGTLRGKYEYQTATGGQRFQVRTARVSVSGNLLPIVSYKAEIDLCDEGQIKMLDAYARVVPLEGFYITIGQMRVPFTIELFSLYFNVCLSVCFSEIIRIFAFVKKTAIEYGNL